MLHGLVLVTDAAEIVPLSVGGHNLGKRGGQRRSKYIPLLGTGLRAPVRHHASKSQLFR